MTLDPLYWIAGISLVVTLISAIGTRALRDFSRHELEILCRKHESDLKFSEILEYDDQVAISVESLSAITTGLFVVSMSLLVLLNEEGLASVNQPVIFWSIVAFAGFALLVFNIWLPWTVTRIWATPIIFHTWRFWKFLSQLLTPFVLMARCLDAIMHRLAGRPQMEQTEHLFEEEIRSIVSEGHREGLLEEDAREMIQGVMELGDVDATNRCRDDVG